MAAPNGKYDPETFPDIARSLARKGHIEKEIAKVLGVSVSTFGVYKREHPEFLKALKEGKAPADAAVEAALFKRACGYTYTETRTVTLADKTVRTETITKEVVPDVVAQIFWLKNRVKDDWRDKQDIEHSGEISWKEVIESAGSTDQNK